MNTPQNCHPRTRILEFPRNVRPTATPLKLLRRDQTRRLQTIRMLPSRRVTHQNQRPCSPQSSVSTRIGLFAFLPSRATIRYRLALQARQPTPLVLWLFRPFLQLWQPSSLRQAFHSGLEGPPVDHSLLGEAQLGRVLFWPSASSVYTRTSL